MRLHDILAALTGPAALAVGLAKRIKLGLVVIVLVAVAISHPAAAAPKNSSNSCTIADIKSPRAAACIKQAEDDINKNAPYVHYVLCSNDGANAACGSDMCCCQKGHGCAAIAKGRSSGGGSR
jgi:hypothetical protein